MPGREQDGNALRTPCGAIPTSDTSTRFEVWAPRAREVVVELYSADEPGRMMADHPLEIDEQGMFTGEVDGAGPGSLYRYSLDGMAGRPDPRSRFQPIGVHGPSQVVDPSAYAWKDGSWRGIAKRDLVIYEMHLGSFSETGDYQGAIEKLPELVDLGITAVELLPLAQSPGRWNWGYDGVNFFAPRNTFGSPGQLKAFVDACHQQQIAVINDVVFNHIGPEGNYLAEFGPYRSPTRNTPWGDAFNFDGPGNEQVRQFVIDNIFFWIDEYHFDGVRLDAVHYMFDDSEVHILDEIRDRFRQHQRHLDRRTLLIGESNIYDPHLVGDPAADQPHHDALWSDCLMHSIYAVGAPDVRLTNRHYRESDLAESLEHAYVFCTPDAVRVTPEIRSSNHPGAGRQFIESLITALQTHDSVGNHPHGKRLHQLTSIDFHMAAAPLILLYPSIPMIFMGEESANESPFPFFADFEDDRLRAAVDRGRREEYPHHDWSDSPLPSDPLAFESSRLQAGDPAVRKWYRELIAFRKSGVESGWLHVDRMQSGAQEVHKVYRLIYDHPGGELHIVSRLDRAGAEPVSLDGEGIQSVLYSSKPEHGNELAPQHAMIWLG